MCQPLLRNSINGLISKMFNRLICVWNERRLFIFNPQNIIKAKTSTLLGPFSHSVRLSTVRVFHQSLSKASLLLRVRTILSSSCPTQKDHSAAHGHFLKKNLSSGHMSLEKRETMQCLAIPVWYPVERLLLSFPFFQFQKWEGQSQPLCLSRCLIELIFFGGWGFWRGLRNAGRGSRIVFSSGNCRWLHHPTKEGWWSEGKSAGREERKKRVVMMMMTEIRFKVTQTPHKT